MNSSSEPKTGRVTLVGAGPGDPNLLTLRGKECLEAADLIIYDLLVSPELLDLAPATARRLAVESLHPTHPERAPLVIATMIDEAKRGLHVVRLKGGDPFLFGRGGEECEALRAEGIPYEVVPGVSAAFGAAAFAGIPLTHRDHSSSVTLVTGHEHPDKDEPVVDWESLARLHGTLAIYMGLTRLGLIADRLMAAGRDPETPVAAIQRATTGGQRIVTAPLRRIAEEVVAAGLRSPTVVLVGEVVALRERIAWREALPLFGQRVLVTRPRGQAGEMTRLLQEQGAVVSLLPTVEVREPDDLPAVDAAIAALPSFQWVVFTSVNGVKYFLDRIRLTGRDLRALGGVRLAVIGPATAAALREYYLEPDAMPASFRSEELAATLLPLVAGQRVLLARADRGREVLREELGKVAQVEQVAVYSQVDSPDLSGPTLEPLQRGEVDWITFTSPNLARSLAKALPSEGTAAITSGRTKIATISPVTSAAVRELGWNVSAEAVVYTGAGIVQALVRTVAG